MSADDRFAPVEAFVVRVTEHEMGYNVETLDEAMAPTIEALISSPPPWLDGLLYQSVDGWGGPDDLDSDEYEAVRSAAGEVVREIVETVLMEYASEEFRVRREAGKLPVSTGFLVEVRS